MKTTPLALAAAIGSAFALGSVVTLGSPAPARAADMEKCYGVAKAGRNDCQTATSSCAGTSRTDGRKDAFILVPAGTCEKLVGGSTTPGQS